jgi:3-oxoacyl-(acyl-carrier-protein) synthase
LAAKQALRDAALDMAEEDPYSIDIIYGQSFSSLDCLYPKLIEQNGEGMYAARPSTPALLNPAVAATEISRALGIYGEVTNVSTACCSSTAAIGFAARLIESGESTCVLTGGADEGVCPMFLGALGNGEYLSKRNSDPSRASRPFDRYRDGGVLGDAACVMVVEDYERAKARGASIYCEVGGFGGASAAKPGRTDESGAHALFRALNKAQCSPADIDYYCAFGISDPKLDARETRIIKGVFKDDARRLPISSIKSMVGSSLGANGAMQAATCALAIRNRAIPPTINYDKSDPECDLDYVPNEARSARVNKTALFSLGNGGNYTALVLKAC